MAKNKPEEIVKAVKDDELGRAVTEKTAEMKNTQSPEMSEFEAVRRKNGEGHRERLRQRFLRSGAEGLANHEMLELLLFYALPRRDTKPIAHELVNRFGSLAGVLKAAPEQLMEVDFITENAAVLFRLIPELVGVYYSEAVRNVPCLNTAMLAEMFKPHFVGERREVLLLACFDGELKPLGVTKITKGTSECTQVEMRTLLQYALNTDCTMAALAHNHPGKPSEPSDADIAVTRRINGIFREVNIRLMDHIIVGSSGIYSFRDNGDLGIFD